MGVNIVQLLLVDSRNRSKRSYGHFSSARQRGNPPEAMDNLGVSEALLPRPGMQIGVATALCVPRESDGELLYRRGFSWDWRD